MFKIIVAFIISVLISLAFYYKTKPDLTLRQRLALTFFRIIALYVVLIFLLTPIIYYIKNYKEQPVVALLKDNSGSMDIKHETKSKTESIILSYNALLQEYKNNGYFVKEHTFADGLGGRKNSTLLIPSLEELLKNLGKTELHRIILFSDGWFKDTDQRTIRNFNVPLDCIADTLVTRKTDLYISEFRHNKQGYRNELNLFEVEVKALQYDANATVQLFVNGEKVRDKSVNFRNDAFQTITFDYRFLKTGMYKLETRISAAGISEQTLSNNSYLSAIDILSDKERILLLSDAPNWDSKFILDTIRENNRLEPLSYMVKGNELFQGEQKAIISNWDNITAIIIVNQGALRLNSYLSGNIINQVKKGTGLLFTGLSVPELSAILPLKQSNIRSSYQGLLKMLPAAGVYSALQIPGDELLLIPPLDYYYQTAGTQYEVIATMDNASKSPAIAVSSVHSGKVVCFAFTNLWRWQMQSKNQGYRNFTTDLLAWLRNKSSGVMVALYESSYLMGEPIEIKLSALNELRKTSQNIAPLITVFNSQRDTVFSDYLIKDGDYYKVLFRTQKADTYDFRISDKSSGLATNGKFIVHSQSTESNDLGYNIPLLSWISSQTNGKFMSIEEALSYKPLKAMKKNKIERKEYPLYKKWYLVFLFITMFCLELFFRRRWGLL